MDHSFLKVADIFFFVLHTALILFNSIGYLFSKTRRANLISLLLTAFSWFVLGIWYGWGYCWFTDLHWQVRRALGYVDNTNSYIDLLIMKITGFELNNGASDTCTVIVFATSLIASIYLNFRKR